MSAGQIIWVVLSGIFKFFFSGLVSYGMGNSFWETLLLTGASGCFGMVVFYLAGARVLEWFRQRHLRRLARALALGKAPKRIFTRTNRLIVSTKRRWGIKGLAGLAPPILSIPITAVLAAKYFRHDRRTLPLLLSSVLIWSFVLSLGWKVVQ
ncbi:MAG TPA: hypothetical protein VHL57_10260 [Flavobacteriales bacterium]|jgi:hypothetical protein|nr:hypothetical protein [Flavobacteriales bacterium]